MSPDLSAASCSSKCVDFIIELPWGTMLFVSSPTTFVKNSSKGLFLSVRAFWSSRSEGELPYFPNPRMRPAICFLVGMKELINFPVFNDGVRRVFRVLKQNGVSFDQKVRSGCEGTIMVKIISLVKSWSMDARRMEGKGRWKKMQMSRK